MKKGLTGLMFSILVFIFCMTLSISYAWFANNSSIKVSNIDISAVKYKADVNFYKYENDNWVLLDSNSTVNDALKFNNLVPSQYETFRIDIINTGNTTFNYKFLIANYINSNVNDGNDVISDYMYININKLDSLLSFSNNPKTVYDDNYNPLTDTIPFSINGISNLSNTYTSGSLNENEKVHIIFKVYFSAYANIKQQSQGFEIKKIRIIG